VALFDRKGWHGLTEIAKKQVPQKYLQEKIKKSQSPLEKGLFSKLVDFLNETSKQL
jgi:hypothetical protein